MRRTEWRRLSAESGFWNTICSARDVGRACARRASAASGRPSSVDRRPASASTMPSSVRASVVLPLPDSPTRPSVSPSCEDRRDAGQRVYGDAVLRERLRQVGRSAAAAPRCGRRPCRAARSSVTRGRLCARLVEVAAAVVAVADERERAASSCGRRPAASAQRSTKTQPGSSAPSSGRKPGIVSSRPSSLRTPPRGMQRSRPDRVRVPRVVQDLLRHRPPRRARRRRARRRGRTSCAIDAEVVADEEHGGVELRLQARDEVEHLGLDGRVEARRRLVEDQQLRDRSRAPSRSRRAAACRRRAGADSAASRESGSAIWTSRSIADRALARLVAARSAQLRRPRPTCRPTRSDGFSAAPGFW